VVDQLRLDLFLRPVQGASLSQYNVHGDGQGHQRQWKRHRQGDGHFADYHDANIGKDAAGKNAAVYREHAGDVDGKMRDHQFNWPLHRQRSCGDKLHH